MKFGMPTLVECDGILDCVKVAEECGLDFIEMNMSFPQYQPDALSADTMRELAKRYGLFYTIHADEMLNPFDFNERVSGCYFEVMADTISFAKAISARVINMHLLQGVYVTLPDRRVLLTDVYRDEYLNRVKEFIKMCEREVGDSELKIAIENVDTNLFTESQLEALKLFMESDVFYLTLDTGHEMCLGFKDKHVFDKYPDRLCHMHLHDSNGRSCHLPLGSADVDVYNDKIEIILADHGPGIPNIELAMQEGYSTAPDNIRSLGFGAGMGLPNMKRYTDDMRIESAIGEGTTIYMTVRT